ncbi:hypothetical protein MASR2M15_16260 [Anaerolineales bacterium]
MPYYPDQRFASRLISFTRECLLPESAVGRVRVKDGALVDIRDVVAKGFMPSRLHIIEAAEILGLKDKANVDRMLLVDRGQMVKEKTPIAGKDRKKGKRILAPTQGMIVKTDPLSGRIIFREQPQMINLQAGVQGEVVRYYPNRGVGIQAVGAIVQGVWGNNDSQHISTLKIEPKDGIESIITDQFDTNFRGAIVVTYRPLKRISLELASQQNIIGIIAPSMDADLIALAEEVPTSLMLTEGFGQMTMNHETFSMLKEFDGYQVTIDAYQPRPWEPRRPEVIISRIAPADSHPPAPNFKIQLAVGMTVRVTQQPFLGQLGTVQSLPLKTQKIQNGLRVPVANVQLIAGERVNIPLTDLELVGR